MQTVKSLNNRSVNNLFHKNVTKQDVNLFPKSTKNLRSKTDEEIFFTFTEGEIDALGEIYDRYGLLVYRLVYRILDNCQEAEDLTQEIFLRLQERPRFNPERGSFYSYLMMISRSLAIDFLRSRSSRWRLFQNMCKMGDLIDRKDSIDIISIQERAIQVKKALESLSLYQRQILELSYYEGLSQSEIAKRLDLPLGTVKTHSRRGLIKLKKTLNDRMKKI